MVGRELRVTNVMAVASVSQLSMLDIGLAPRTEFFYQIQALAPPVQGGPRSQFASSQVLATLTANAVTPAAEAPRDFTRECPPSYSCVIRWKAVPGAAAYAIYRNIFYGYKCVLEHMATTSVPETLAVNHQYCTTVYKTAAVFEIKDFPTPGATYSVEGSSELYFPR